MSQLKNPFRIEVNMSDVIVSYRANYVGVSLNIHINYIVCFYYDCLYSCTQSANAGPKETFFFKRGCNDDWYAESDDLACGKQLDSDGEEVFDSQVRYSVIQRILINCVPTLELPDQKVWISAVQF